MSVNNFGSGSHNILTTAAPPLGRDTGISGKRLIAAMTISVGLNIVLWKLVATLALTPAKYHMRPVEISIVRTPEPVKVHEIVKPKRIPEAVKPVVKPKFVPPPKPVHIAHPIVHPAAFIKPVIPPGPARTPPPVPQGAHQRVLTAPDTSAGAKSPDHAALAGGNADAGVPAAAQTPGNGKVSPPAGTKTEDTKPVAPPPPVKQVAIAPPAPVVEQHAQPAPVTPQVVAPPKRSGPTREAEPTDQVRPEIPDNLKQGDFKSFVRVKVEVDEDGMATTILRTSSGVPEIDNRVLAALKQWKWKPALKDGVPVKSTQLFKFEFLVE